MKTIVNSVWIGKELSLLEQLSIKLLQRQGAECHLWAYNEIKGVPEGVVLRDASEIMPADSLFTFKGTGMTQGHGIGSCAHWSDIFQLKLLKKYGGWYSQLDVSCLKLPDEENEYYFANHIIKRIVNTFIMKVPAEAPFIDKCIEELGEKVNKDTSDKIDWLDGMRIIGSHVHDNNLNQFISNNIMECGFSKYMSKPGIMPTSNIQFIHWCNSLCHDIKNNPIPGTFYHRLLEQEGLVEKSKIEYTFKESSDAHILEKPKKPHVLKIIM
jgi:hypothetical protein